MIPQTEIVEIITLVSTRVIINLTSDLGTPDITKDVFVFS